MTTGIVQIIKETAVNAVNASNPVSFTFGTVIKENPLEIKIDNNLILKQEDGVLKLARNVTDYEVEMTMQWTTENTSGGSGESSFESHNHGIRGKKKVTIHQGLKLNEKVILVKIQGGQSYLVWDRVGV